MHHYDGLPGNGKCWYGQKTKFCRNDQLYMAKCSNDKRQKFQLINLSNGEVQFKIGNGENLCFERVGRQIFLRGCSSSNKQQRFYAPNGSFDGFRFEVSQRSYPSQCMTQDHVSKLYQHDLLLRKSPALFLTRAFVFV